jgi:predicted kinase
LKELIILIGPQGSGKSTFCKSNYTDYTRISQDEQGDKKHFHLFCAAIKEGQNVILDRTNPNVEQRSKYLNIVKKENYYTKAIVLTTSKSVCLDRLTKRIGHKYNTDDCWKGLLFWFKMYEEPTKDEFDEIRFI